MRGFVKDYIIENSDDAVKDITKQNYLAYIFMPKQDINIVETNFCIVVDENQTVALKLVKQDVNDVTIENATGTTNLTDEKIADASWVKDNKIETSFESGKVNAQVSEFTAINQDNLQALTTATSIFKMLKNNIYTTYFNEIANNLSSQTKYTAQALISNIKTQNYVYLKLQPTNSFLLAEMVTEIADVA